MCWKSHSSKTRCVMVHYYTCTPQNTRPAPESFQCFDWLPNANLYNHEYYHINYIPAVGFSVHGVSPGVSGFPLPWSSSAPVPLWLPPQISSQVPELLFAFLSAHLCCALMLFPALKVQGTEKKCIFWNKYNEFCYNTTYLISLHFIQVKHADPTPFQKETRSS